MLQELSFFNIMAIQEGFRLTSKLQKSIEANYNVAKQVPIETFYELFDEAVYRNVKKLKELLSQVKEAYEQLTFEEVPCFITISPTRQMLALLKDLEGEIQEAIYKKLTAQGKRPEIFTIIIITSNNKKAE